ncbi:hypothetical protein [Chryseobacterium sp. KCF3-3]|uniref:DMP19 family protein n=1 Tax=Chryseobacterium sp. KCF3-3 TaxID=3231511 RepID=UPI0038B2CC33
MIPLNFVRIESLNSSERYLPEISSQYLIELSHKYSDLPFNQFQNEYTDLCMKLSNDVYSMNKYWEKNMTHGEFLNMLTKEQRILFGLINFESQVNNGGIYQFLFNELELSVLVLESLEILKFNKLSEDYKAVLKDYFFNFETIEEIQKKFLESSYDWDERWNSFVEGYKIIKNVNFIESYFYETDFIEEFQNKIKEFIKSNLFGLCKIID